LGEVRAAGSLPQDPNDQEMIGADPPAPARELTQAQALRLAELETMFGEIKQLEKAQQSERRQANEGWEQAESALDAADAVRVENSKKKKETAARRADIIREMKTLH
jgi:hypothetical protein